MQTVNAAYLHLDRVIPNPTPAQDADMLEFYCNLLSTDPTVAEWICTVSLPRLRGHYVRTLIGFSEYPTTIL